MRISRSLLGTGAALAVAGLALAGCTGEPAEDATAYASGDPNTLIFAVLPDREGASQDNAPIAEWIAAITGKEVEIREATDYAAVVQGLAAHQIDIAQISAFTYFQTQQAGGDIIPIGAQITQEGAEPGYYSVAIANPEWEGETLADFADEPICFVNPTSTSGFAVPMGGLIGAGVVPEDEYILAPEGGTHDANALKVAEGDECMVGFAQDINADPLVATGELREISRVLAPAAPLVMHALLPQEVQDQLLAEMADSTQETLTAHGIELTPFLEESWFGFGPVDDSYYDLIRDLCSTVADKVENCRA